MDHPLRRRPNVLFITLDQFRGDSLSCAGHPVVKTPWLDRLAESGVRLNRHYSQAAPCSPGRAALYTGTYQMNNRVVANGTPLDARFDNVARVALRAGYEPTLFGYTDQSVDPRTVADSGDPRLSTYEGILPGFISGLDLTGQQLEWVEWLQEQGYAVSTDDPPWSHEGERPGEVSISTFLTNRLIDWIGTRPPDRPWFAHASYLRPHPPYSAAGSYATMYEPEHCPPALPIPDIDNRLFRALLENPLTAVAKHPLSTAEIRAQYYGMVSEVDANLGRVWDTLQRLGQWDDTVIIVTADHGDQLGDQGLRDKAGFFESSYHVVGIVRDPSRPDTHGTVVEDFTENVDILPTICELIDMPVPLQCDGLPLTRFLDGARPTDWRDAATYEWDWRDSFISNEPDGWPWDRRLERQNLAVRRTATHAYVQFGNGTFHCFDLATDPTWQTEEHDPEVILSLARDMLVWRATHTERTLTGMLNLDGGIGRVPPRSV